jgi:hypothetical protein
MPARTHAVEPLRLVTPRSERRWRRTEFGTGGRGRRRRRPRRGRSAVYYSMDGWIGSCCNQIGGLLIDRWEWDDDGAARGGTNRQRPEFGTGARHWVGPRG